MRNPFTRRIIYINDVENRVYLNDNTVWYVDGNDSSYLDSWKVNDFIIVGDYSPWVYFMYSFDTILINVNKNHYVHAIQN